MAYASNYYNYQVGIIFAILIGGLLLLAAFVVVVYYGCINAMRQSRKRRYSPAGVIHAEMPREWRPTGPIINPYERNRNVQLNNFNSAPKTTGMQRPTTIMLQQTSYPEPLIKQDWNQRDNQVNMQNLQRGELSYHTSSV